MTDIKVLSKDEVKIRGCFWRRSEIVEAESGESSIVYKLGWREILRMMDEFEEPAPKWEPGTVLINRQGWKYRLDKLIGANDPEMWEYTNMQSGRTSPGLFYPFAYKIHRLSNEFRRDDWAQVVSGLHEPFKVNTIVPKGNGDSYVYGREQQQWLASSLKHVPAPKEEKPSLLVKSCEHCGKTLDGMDPRIHPHGLGVCAPRNEKPENPFTGRHWDEVARDANREDALAETLCIKDLRDELDRQAGRKP